MTTEKYIIRAGETGVKIAATRAVAVKRKNIVKTGVRVFDGKRIGVAGGLGDQDHGELTARATRALELDVPYPYAPTKNVRAEHVSAELEIDERNFAAEIEAFADALRAAQPDFIFSTPDTVALQTSEVTLKNDAGLDLLYRDRFMTAFLLFKEKSSANVFDGFAGFVGRKYDRAKLVGHIGAFCDAFRKKAEFSGAGTYPVVFTTRNLHFLTRMINEMSGLRYGTNSSIFSGKAGQRIFSENFTLYQSMEPEHEFGPFFDAEGTTNPGNVRPLIEKGVFAAPFTDKKTAATYSLPLTGAASADYDEVPKIGSPGFRIAGSGRAIKHILGGRPAIFVVIASGGDFTPTGDFGSPVQLSYLFDGERLAGRLPQLQIASTVYDMFGGAFGGVSSDPANPLDENEKYAVFEMKVSKI